MNLGTLRRPQGHPQDTHGIAFPIPGPSAYLWSSVSDDPGPGSVQGPVSGPGALSLFQGPSPYADSARHTGIMINNQVKKTKGTRINTESHQTQHIVARKSNQNQPESCQHSPKMAPGGYPKRSPGKPPGIPRGISQVFSFSLRHFHPHQAILGSKSRTPVGFKSDILPDPLGSYWWGLVGDPWETRRKPLG